MCLQKIDPCENKGYVNLKPLLKDPSFFRLFVENKFCHKSFVSWLYYRTVLNLVVFIQKIYVLFVPLCKLMP